ncbi:MAG: hypothetical protein ACREQ9_19300 [Candidatus Binatia bacterium]
MKTPAPCHGRPLAVGRACKVDACGCGTIHVSIGMLTVRLEREAFEALCETLLEAAGRLGAPSGQRLC